MYERALRALPGPESAPVAGTLFRWIGRSHLEGGDAEAALDCFEAARAVAEAAGHGPGLASVANSKATVAFKRGHLDEAERLWTGARRQARTHGEKKLQAMVEQNLGIVANIRGELEVALTRYRTALHTYRRLGMEGYRAQLLNNLGMLLTDLERWEEAEEAFGEALGLARDRSDVSVETCVEMNRARLQAAQGEWALARDHLDSAHELALRADDDRWLGEIFRHYGAIFRETERYNLAGHYLDRARRTAEARGDLLLEAEVAREEGDLHAVLGRNRQTLHHLVRAHRLFTELQARRQLADVDRRMRELEEVFLRITREWGESIESKDRYTQGHCERVARLARALADAAGLASEYLVWFEMGALLHDVGKVAVPLEVLNKEGSLTPEEWRLLRSHPEEGVRLLGDVAFPWDIRPMMRHHHEHWDGSGYPDGLAGAEIPFSARILTVTDIYDALTTDRAYRGAHTREEALEIMERESGQTVDPRLFALFRDEVLPRVETERHASGASEPRHSAVGARSRGERKGEGTDMEEDTETLPGPAPVEPTPGPDSPEGPPDRMRARI